MALQPCEARWLCRCNKPMQGSSEEEAAAALDRKQALQVWGCVILQWCSASQAT